MIYDLARIRHEVNDLAANRDAVINQFSLDERFCLPDGNWHQDAANDYLKKYIALRDCSVDEIVNVIRPLSENYSGYHFPCGDEFNHRNLYYYNVWLSMNGKMRLHRDGKWIIEDESAWSNHRAITSEYLFRPLQIPGERGPVHDGVVINKDTCAYQGYVNSMIHTGIIDALKKRPRPVIVEIGAGYGALALALSQILGGDILYIICDIPESLMFSGLYLTLAGRPVRIAGDGALSADPGTVLLPNYWFHRLIGALDRDVDLAINTLSMSEMSVHQVKAYAQGISKLIGQHGVFFEHNYDNHRLDRMINCKDHLPEFFPFRKTTVHKDVCDLWSNASLA